MMQATLIFGLPGAGKSALARSLIQDSEGPPPSAWFADDDRTLNFDATCLDLSRSDWASQRLIWFRNGSCFVLNLDLTAKRIAHLQRSGIHQIFIVCSVDPSEFIKQLAAEAVVKVTKSVLVLDAELHLRELVLLDNAMPKGSSALERYLKFADIVVLNKRDLISREGAAWLKNWLMSHRGHSLEVVEARFGRLKSSQLAVPADRGPAWCNQVFSAQDDRGASGVAPQNSPYVLETGGHSLAP